MLPIVIIGAGPAGSAAAACLARSGHRVILAEAKTFPRAKVCGEFVSPAATALLESLVAPSDLLTAGARRIESLSIELQARRCDWRLPAPAWALSRATLDTLLLSNARRAGVTLLQPVRVTRVDYGAANAPLAVVLADSEPIHAALVIHADGSGRLDPAGPVPAREGVLALKCHFTPADPLRGLRMRSAHGAYVGTVQVEGPLATCALVARAGLLAPASRRNTAPGKFGLPILPATRSSSLDTRADRLVSAICPDFKADLRAGPWQACVVGGSGYVTPGHPRSLRVGNAAAAVEPVGGEGIGLALWSGITLAAMLADLSPGDDLTLPTLSELHRRFAAAYRVRLRSRLPACRAAAEVLMRPTLASALWPALAIPRLTLAPWYALTGKALRGTASSTTTAS